MFEESNELAFKLEVDKVLLGLVSSLDLNPILAFPTGGGVLCPLIFVSKRAGATCCIEEFSSLSAGVQFESFSFHCCAYFEGQRVESRSNCCYP